MFLQIPTIVIKAAAQSQHPVLELLLSVVPVTIAAIGGIWAVIRYLNEAKRSRLVQEAVRADAAKSAAIEARKPFLAKQQEVYFELLRNTAILGNNYANTPQWQMSYKRFWELYWGEIPVVADPEVGAAVDAFADTVDNTEDIDGVSVRNASMNLGRACRESMAKSWKTVLELPERTERTTGSENVKTPFGH